MLLRLLLSKHSVIVVQNYAAVALDDPRFCSFPERLYVKARNDCLHRARPAPAAPSAI
jgi:hypothetical protein